MNYIEIRVKKLLEQVLKGEKNIPRVLIEESPIGNEYKLKFSKNLYLIYTESTDVLSVEIDKNRIKLFKEERKILWKMFCENLECIINNKQEIHSEKSFKPTKDMLELEYLFKKVFEYSEKIDNHKDIRERIDEVFGELE